MLIRDINKFSNNVMTQQLFLTMGAAGGEPGNPARGAAAVRGLLAARGIDAPELVLENGCGLSRIERISAGSLGNVLADAWKSQWMPELMASLPISGVDGTMKARNVPAGAAHMKTGMLEDTRAVAGYVLAASGRRYVVVAIINHPNASRGTGRARRAARLGVPDGLKSRRPRPIIPPHVSHTITCTGHGTHGLPWLRKNHAAEPHPHARSTASASRSSRTNSAKSASTASSSSAPKRSCSRPTTAASAARCAAT